jgi:hypothetical protein
LKQTQGTDKGVRAIREMSRREQSRTKQKSPYCILKWQVPPYREASPNSVHSEHELLGIGLELIYPLNQEISLDLDMSRVALIKYDSVIAMSRSQVVRENHCLSRRR